MDRLLAMEAFVKTVDAGSMSGAATQMGIANASVTTLIRNLEAHLGITLLHRSTRYVRLSDEGTCYYERCRSILQQIDQAEAGVVDRELGPRGVLRLETPIAVGHLIIGPALAEFSRRHPNLRVITSLNNEVENLIKRGMDVAIRIDAVESGDLVAKLIYRARHMLCASPGFLAARGAPAGPDGIDPKQCLGFADYPSGELRLWRFRKDGTQHVISPDGTLFFNSTDALMQAAMHGAGLVYVLDVLVEQYLRRGDLVHLLPEWETDDQSFFAVYVKTSFTPPKVRAFVDFLATLFPTAPDHLPVPIRAR
ncbi:LysR family transcriptional regulator [Humitalea rosea]|uniref:LysR family transcriptional regulator n=1 Tax=Humitalea rosea TaxID=990373 RepID=A0A2W7ISS9_9PROT|nr:LysR family transcriptional regulator [Humitalea rosea]PZW50906.1 LysR family transcriptional regulator [Humitalea rosea]